MARLSRGVKNFATRLCFLNKDLTNNRYCGSGRFRLTNPFTYIIYSAHDGAVSFR